MIGMDSSDQPRRRQQTLARSFRVAWDGLVAALRSDRNLRIHAVATVLVIAAGWLVQLSLTEWAVITLTIGMVWVSELINTAIEAAVDLASPDFHELARLSKDVSSGAVLAASVAAVVVGLLIFGPHLISS